MLPANKRRESEMRFFAALLSILKAALFWGLWFA